MPPIPLAKYFDQIFGRVWVFEFLSANKNKLIS